MTYKEFVALINQKFRGVGIVCVGHETYHTASIGDITINYYMQTGKTVMYHRIAKIGEITWA